MVRRIRSALKALEIAILKDVKSLLVGSNGHTTEVHGLHSLAAAFEDEADRRTLSFIPG
jgi:hypothetical protein